MNPQRPLLVLLGPTAVGKTALALRLALRFNGEVVSADSRQIFRGMDIATAKPTPTEQAAVPHHLIDVVDPDEPFTLSEYQAAAYRAIDDLQARGRLPLLTGGAGLYIRAVIEGLSIPRVPPDSARRAALASEPSGALYARLHSLDPIAASKILPSNTRRVIRALEVIEATGLPISEQQRRTPPPYTIFQIGLTRPRAELYRRVDDRIDAMLAAGLVKEVSELLARGYSYDLPSMTGLGYRELGLYLRGELPLKEAVTLFKHNTHRFIRHQSNWFRLSDPQIHWFDLGEPQASAEIETLVAEFLHPSEPADD